MIRWLLVSCNIEGMYEEEMRKWCREGSGCYTAGVRPVQVGPTLAERKAISSRIRGRYVIKKMQIGYRMNLFAK